ncbi:MAG: hypothetical protein CMH57_15480 [Myxococcales bacterium]|nr:hypothetical protein [Myxococcales bacterium]
MRGFEDLWWRFQSLHYQRHNQRRLEHLTSLGLPLSGRSVLEVGAGIGDHARYFLDRGCAMTITEGRPRCVEVIRRRYPGIRALELDLDSPNPDALGDARFDVVYCYGVLYHLARPAEALRFLAERSRGLLLLETCVRFGPEDTVTFHEEPPEVGENALSGRGCRPSRAWLWRELGALFPHVYLPTTQPWHEEFPTDWTTPPDNPFLIRAVFVASRTPLSNPALTTQLLTRQERCP